MTRRGVEQISYRDRLGDVILFLSFYRRKINAIARGMIRTSCPDSVTGPGIFGCML